MNYCLNLLIFMNKNLLTDDSFLYILCPRLRERIKYAHKISNITFRAGSSGCGNRVGASIGRVLNHNGVSLRMERGLKHENKKIEAKVWWDVILATHTHLKQGGSLWHLESS